MDTCALGLIEALENDNYCKKGTIKSLEITEQFIVIKSNDEQDLESGNYNYIGGRLYNA